VHLLVSLNEWGRVLYCKGRVLDPFFRASFFGFFSPDIIIFKKKTRNNNNKREDEPKRSRKQ
jgi:hypothetical protein